MKSEICATFSKCAWRTISYDQRLELWAHAIVAFLFIKLAKNDRIFHFYKAKVIVFNTNLEQGNYRVARNFCGSLFLWIGHF